jgi:hypothetical protein
MPSKPFERRLLLAHCRGLIYPLALVTQDEFHQEGLAADSDALAVEIARRINAARPRSRYVPWFLPDSDLEAVIKKVVADLVQESHG